MRNLLSGKRGSKGFTLAELLIVIAIIAILTAIAIPTFSASLERARKAADDANIRAAYAQAMVDTLMATSSAEVSSMAVVATAPLAYYNAAFPTFQYYTGITISGTAGLWAGVK